MVKQPQERLEKLIIVSVYSDGRRVWGLMGAKKVGNSYRIALTQYDQLVIRLNKNVGSTLSA